MAVGSLPEELINQFAEPEDQLRANQSDDNTESDSSNGSSESESESSDENDRPIESENNNATVSREFRKDKITASIGEDVEELDYEDEDVMKLHPSTEEYSSENDNEQMEDEEDEENAIAK